MLCVLKFIGVGAILFLWQDPFNYQG